MKLMSNDRQEHLVRSVEKVANLIAAGTHPDLALTKVAGDDGLTKNEITNVSHAVNTGATLGHIRSEKPEKRDSPFLLTNADFAVGKLYGADQGEPTHAAEEAAKGLASKPDLDSKNIADKTKKQASAASYHDVGSYFAVPKVAAEDIRPMFGKAPALAKIASAAVSHDLTLTLGDGEFLDEHSIHQGLHTVKQAADEARTRASGIKDRAYGQLQKIANAFTYVTGPGQDGWTALEQLSKVAGIDELTVSAIYELGNLQSIGIRRPLAGAKLASHSDTVKGLVREILGVENMFKQAADALVVREQLLGEVRAVEAKLAAAGMSPQVQAATEFEITPKADIDVGGAAKGFNETAKNLVGGRGLSPDVMSLIGDATGNSGNAPTFAGSTEQPLLDYNTRQEGANHQASALYQRLAQDEFVKSHPTHEVVQAFDRIHQSNPNVGEAAMLGLLRQELAGGAPVDLLLRAQKG